VDKYDTHVTLFPHPIKDDQSNTGIHGGKKQ